MKGINTPGQAAFPKGGQAKACPRDPGTRSEMEPTSWFRSSRFVWESIGLIPP